MAKEQLVYVGIKGQVVALSRQTGDVRWSTVLSTGLLGGSPFVHVVLDGNDLYATANGVLSCLDAATGNLRWKNGLKGYGTEIASIATSGGHSLVDLAAATAEQRSAAASTAAVTGE